MLLLLLAQQAAAGARRRARRAPPPPRGPTPRGRARAPRAAARRSARRAPTASELLQLLELQILELRLLLHACTRARSSVRFSPPRSRPLVSSSSAVEAFGEPNIARAVCRAVPRRNFSQAHKATQLALELAFLAV